MINERISKIIAIVQVSTYQAVCHLANSCDAIQVKHSDARLRLFDVTSFAPDSPIFHAFLYVFITRVLAFRFAFRPPTFMLRKYFVINITCMSTISSENRKEMFRSLQFIGVSDAPIVDFAIRWAG